MDIRDFARRYYPGSRIVATWFSYFSTILLIETPAGPRLIKSLVPEVFEVTPDPAELGWYLNDLTVSFRAALVKKGVPLVPQYEMYVEGGNAFHVSSYYGQDVWVVASGRPGDLKYGRELSRLVLKAIRGVLVQDQCSPEVGLDARLSNFAIKRMVYVDTFPPLVKVGGVYHVHFPEPTTSAEIESEVNRKFRRLGILHRLAYDFLAVNPAWEGVFVEEAVDLFGSEVAAFFADLPDRKIVGAPLSEALAMLEGLGSGDKDTLRCLAARLLPVDGRRPDNMQAIFSLSRKDPSEGYPGPHEDRIGHLKRWLAELLAWRR